MVKLSTNIQIIKNMKYENNLRMFKHLSTRLTVQTNEIIFITKLVGVGILETLAIIQF